MSHAHATLLIAGLFVVGLFTLGFALSGYGSRDRTHELPPRLPGHDIPNNGQDRQR